MRMRFGRFWGEVRVVSECNTIQAYLDAVAEQIRWKRAKPVVLSELERHLEDQRDTFASEGCANAEKLAVAELLDKTGRSKEEKEQLGQIENRLATLARLGRAFGIHLILATQRPDANILPGQIKNNLDFRVCGRADNVLSQIILDNTSAADQIPKDARGRFITGGGTVFQGYLFDERQL